MTDGVTEDIFWIQGTRMPWFNTGLGPKKRKKGIHLIYVLYIIYVIHVVYILYVYCISYILHIYVESKASTVEPRLSEPQLTGCYWIVRTRRSHNLINAHRFFAK